jgi:hypothetical protein
MNTYYINNWSVVEEPWNGYTAPECRRVQLKGIRNGEEKYVRTSNIKGVEGKTVYTKNSVYHLQDIDPEYLAHIKEKGYDYDPENPIKVKT